MPRTGARVLGPLLLAGILSVSSPAQSVGPFGKADLGNPARVEASTRYETPPGTGVLVFHVFAEKTGARLNGPVQLLLTNLANGIGLIQRIDGDQEGIFPNLQYGNYEIEASAPGYLSVHKNAQILGTVHTEPIEIVLQRDPSAINLEVSDNVMFPKARKEAKHAVSLLKMGNFSEAQKHLDTAYQLAPTSSDLNFLLGYFYFQKKDYTRAASYLGMAATLSPHNGQALTLLGRANLEQENYPAARSALEQAVLADAENWLPYNLLADTYLGEKNYGKALDEAQIAITKGKRDGKSAASPAELSLGQALLGLGRAHEAIQAFDTFLKESPQNPMVYQVRNLITELKKHDSAPSSDGNAKPSNIDSSRADPLGAVPAPALSVESWRPPDVDDIRPTLTPGVACPAARVIDEAGKRVQELVRDLARFAANEELFHQSIDAFGFATLTETRKYDYVALVSESHPGAVFIEESRLDKPGQGGYPDGIASTGFMVLALVFHPDMQKDFDFRCEGQADWHGQANWLVHFHQRHDRPNRMHSYSVGGQDFPVDLKGRAWITADTFQIVRIEADMVKPMPEIQLLSEHQTVEYGPVPFPKKNTTLWLPKTAEIYFDLRKHRYYRRHSFDHFMLFSVDTGEKRKEPVASPALEKQEKD
jgi:tetratricopeptide (TPR) repeat protein